MGQDDESHEESGESQSVSGSDLKQAEDGSESVRSAREVQAEPTAPAAPFVEGIRSVAESSAPNAPSGYSLGVDEKGSGFESSIISTEDLARTQANADLEQAREVLGKILAAASIQSVVCVDDEYAHKPSSTDAADMLLTIPPEDWNKIAGLAALLDVKPLPIGMPPEVIRELLKKQWNQSNENLQKKVYASLLIQSGSEHQVDDKVAHVVRKLFRGRRLIEKSLGRVDNMWVRCAGWATAIGS